MSSQNIVIRNNIELIRVIDSLSYIMYLPYDEHYTSYSVGIK